jgi:hypothetical protein
MDMLLVLMGSKHLIVSLNLGRSFINGYSIPVLGMKMLEAALLILWLSFLNWFCACCLELLVLGPPLIMPLSSYAPLPVN